MGAVVALDKGTDSVSDVFGGVGLFVVDEAFDHSTGTSGSTFESLATHACSAAGVAFFDGFAGGVLYTANYHGRVNRHSSDVAEKAIPCLGDNWEEEPITDAIGIFVSGDTVFVHTAVARSYGEGVCDDDGGVEKASFVEPVASGHLAGSVPAKVGSVTSFVEEVFAGEDGGYSCIDFFVGGRGWFVDGFSVDKDSWHIGERIKWASGIATNTKGREQFSDSHTAGN